MPMKYRRIVKRVLTTTETSMQTTTETTIELQAFSPDSGQFTEFAYCFYEQPPLAQPDFKEVEPAPAEQTISVVLEDTDEELVGPWSPDPKIDRVLQKVRQEQILQAQLDFLRESKREWRRKYPSRFSRLLSSVGALLGSRT
jgi:hypothetical protein